MKNEPIQPEPIKPKPFGVIFDMDGVLVLSEEAHYESWCMVAESRGVEVTRELFLSTFGQVNEDCIAAMFGSGLGSGLGAELGPDEVERIAVQKEEAYRDLVRASIPLAEGLFPLLDQLKAAGARIAVGSSAPPENVDLVLDAGGLRDYFQAAVNGKQVTKGKPAPDVFLIAAEQLGLAPERCVVIEDAPVGVLAARAAGMRVVVVTTTNTAQALQEAGAHAIVPDLQALDLKTIQGPDLS